MTFSTEASESAGSVWLVLAAAGAAIAVGVAWTLQALELRSLRQQLEDLKRPPQPVPASTAKPGRASGKLMNRLYPERPARFAGFAEIPGGRALAAAVLFTLLAFGLGLARAGGASPSAAAVNPQLAELRGGLDSVSARMRQLDDSVAALRQRALVAPHVAPGSTRPASAGKRPASRLATSPTPAIAPAPPPPAMRP